MRILTVKLNKRIYFHQKLLELRHLVLFQSKALCQLVHNSHRANTRVKHLSQYHFTPSNIIILIMLKCNKSYNNTFKVIDS